MGRWDDWKSKKDKAKPEELPPAEIEKIDTKTEEGVQTSLQDIDESLLFIKIPDYKQIVEELNKLDMSIKETSEKITELEKQKEEEMLSIEGIKQKVVEFEGILIELNKKFSGRLK